MSEPIPPEDLPDPPTLEDPDPIPPPVDFPDGDEVVGWLDAEVSGDRVNVFDAPIVAGDPLGARIEIRSTGFHAFNGTGTETAHIDGAEGVFVGGEFRTSDTLPGQVVMSDTALVLDGAPGPGIAVTPINALPYSEMPGIGPAYDGMTISGGSFTAGESSGMRTAPDIVQQWAFTSGGGYSQVYTTGLQTRMERLNDAGELQSAINASNTQASIAFLTSPTASKGLYVRNDGVWVGVRAGGVLREYNLEETAQDTGWLPLVAPAGVNASANYAYRNKGGVIWFRGSVSPATEWLSGWNVIGSVPDASARPSATTPMREGSSTSGQVLLRVQASGEIALYIHPDITTRTGTYYMSAMTYPAG